jgi:small subunit ribosomal protein S2
VKIRDLLEAGLHFGHQTKRWNPKMKRFIFDQRNGIYIIDLAKSLAQLKEAQQFLYDTVVRGRKVLFVGTKKQAQDAVKNTAVRLNQPYVVHRWLGGTLTNSRTVRQSVRRMRELEKYETDGTMASLSKKEVARLRREFQKLHRNLSGVADMDNPPGALFVVDVNRESIAVAEASRLKIPVVAIVDTNSDPEPIDYPIPGNDDAIRAIHLIINVLSGTIQQASNEYAKIAAEEARRKAAEEAAAAAKAKAEAEARKAQEEVERKSREEALAKLKKEEAAKAAAAPPPAASAAPESKPAADTVVDDKPPATTADAKAEPKAKAKTKPATGAKPEPKPETKTEPKADTKPETRTEAKADTKPETKTEAKADTKPETKAEAEADTKTETGTEKS